MLFVVRLDPRDNPVIPRHNQRQRQKKWREEIDGSEQMAEWPTEYEEQLAREWFADEHEERGQAFGDG